tara:strand:- start:17094 stop:18716 length:1623 start_codon:yes stop_codon:yes gene_type:complete
MTLNRKKRWIASLIGGTIMFLAFPFSGTITPLIFLSFIPLLVVEAQVLNLGRSSLNIFIHSFICFLIFNIGTSWWLWNASAGGAIFAFLFNALVMSLVFQAFHITRKHVGSKQGYLSLPFYWLGFEYLHNHWEFAHPWLTLGNTFSERTTWIQWYEYTGVSGGSLWIIIVNLIGYLIYRNWKQKKNLKGSIILYVLILIIPIATSLYILVGFEGGQFKFKRINKGIETLIIQPNIDPYNEKFDRRSFYAQNQKILKLASKKIGPNTDLIIAPETAISRGFFEPRLKSIIVYPMYRDSLKKWNSELLIGASTMKMFGEKNSRSSRQMNDGSYIEYYNTSILLNTEKEPQFVHKSKLVAGVEHIPYSYYIPFFDQLAINNGGTIGSLGKEKTVKIMETSFGKIAPIVCYESVFSEFVAEQTRLGAELLCVITNDGWWKDTPGYKQHFSFARLRAIENRKWLIRSANTGKSGVISPTGGIVKETEWWIPDVISAKVHLLNQDTNYTKYGDFLGRSSAFLAVFIFIFALSKIIKPNSIEKSNRS